MLYITWGTFTLNFMSVFHLIKLLQSTYLFVFSVDCCKNHQTVIMSLFIYEELKRHLVIHMSDYILKNINNWGLFLSRRLVDRITCHTESPLSWLWRFHLYLLSLGRDRLNLFIKSQMWSQFTEQICFDGAERFILCRFGADVLTLIATSHRPVFA